MKRLLLVIFPICILGTWGSILVRNVKAPAQYQEYLDQAKQVYEQEYYRETLEWIGKIPEIQDEEMLFEIAKLKRDTYHGMGDMTAYINQCQLMVESYPEAEANYVYLIRGYQEIQDMESLYHYLPLYREKWPENKELLKLEQDLDKSYDYVHTGYYDVQYATSTLLDIQAMEFSEYDGKTYVERKLCRSNGQEVFDLGYSQMRVARDSSSCFVQDQEGNWSRVDISGNLLAKNPEVSFESVGSLGENQIASAVIDGTYHFINDKMVVSDLEWDYAATFAEGLNAVKKDGKWALVTTDTWTTVAEFPYTDIAVNSFDSCVVDGKCVVADQNGYYILDVVQNVVITKNYYQEIKAFESSQPTAYRSGEKWGFINKSGEIYQKACYEDAKPYVNGYAAVKQNGLWGYIDQYGTMVIEPQFLEALHVMADGTAYVKNELGYWDYIVIHKLYYTNGES